MRSALASLALGLPVALAACVEPIAPPAATAGAPTAPAPSARAATVTDPTPSVARSTATAPPPRGGLEIVVSRAEITMGGVRIVPLPEPPAWVEGFAAPHKRGGAHGLFVVPLARAVSEARGARHAATLSVAPDIPYRVLTEVLFTLGQSEVSTVSLLVARADGSLGAIEHEAPRAAPGDLAAQAEAMAAELAVLGGGSRTAGAHAGAAPPPAVVLARDGVVVSAGGKRLGPGCAGPGLTAGPTLARRAGSEHDWAALTACAASVRAVTPADWITLSAAPETDFQTVVRAIDALRPSFPRVVFAIAR